MSLLTELTSVLSKLKIPVETGVFSGIPPDTYAVLTPLADSFALYADNAPNGDIQEVRISLFCKDNYSGTKNAIVRALLSADFTITDRRYIGHEDDTGYHHYAIDTLKEFMMEE